MSEWWKRLLFGWACGLPIYVIVGAVTRLWPLAALCAVITTALAIKDWDTHKATKP